MSAAPQYLGRAGEELARQRMDDYARLAELVREQEAALEREDAGRFTELADAIDALKDRLSLPEWVGESPPSPEGGGASGRSDLVATLRDALARSQKMHSKLKRMRDESASQIRRVSRSASGVHTYLKEEETSDDRASKVDVRL